MPESHDAESHPYDERGHDHHDWPHKLACLVLGALEPHFLPGSGGDEWRTGLGAENAETPGGAETRDWADVAVSGVVVLSVWFPILKRLLRSLRTVAGAWIARLIPDCSPPPFILRPRQTLALGV